MKKGCEQLRPIEREQWLNILSGNDIAMDEVAFTWSNSRGMAHAMEQLQGFTGTLLTDGYAAYTSVVKKLNKHEHTITHASCWAHLRRMFEKADDAAPVESQWAVDIIANIYDVEEIIHEKQMTADNIMQTRMTDSEPLVTQFYKWVYEQRQRTDLLPKHPLTKELTYAHNRQAEMKVYLTHPQVSIDTNHLERALRVIPMGRKNHLFCWTELGAEHLGILHSLTVTCRIHGINPYHYLVDVLQRVSQHPAKDVIDLTPRRWKELLADKRLRSDVENISLKEK
jgi:transposase